jgi:hypothetical protein
MVGTFVAMAALIVSCGSDSPTSASVSPSLAAASSSTTGQPTTEPSTTPSNEPGTIETALDAIGADCDKPLRVETDCTWKGVAFTLDSPADWQQTADLRQQACDQGYVNTGYLIATDGESWFAAADYNQDTRALAIALQEAGLNADVQGYCG